MTTHPSGFRQRLRSAIRTSGLDYRHKGDLMGLLARGDVLEAWQGLKESGDQQRDQLAAPSRPAETPIGWAGRRHSATGGITSYRRLEDRSGYGHPAPVQRSDQHLHPENIMTKITTHIPCPTCQGKGRITRHRGCPGCQGRGTNHEIADLDGLGEIHEIQARLKRLEVEMKVISYLLSVDGNPPATDNGQPITVNR